MDMVLDSFYGSSSKSLHQFPEFQDAVPYKALLLVAGMVSRLDLPQLELSSPCYFYKVHATLCLFRTYGFIDEKTVKLNSQNIQAVYNKLTEQMEAVLLDPYHSKKLDRMLSN